MGADLLLASLVIDRRRSPDFEAGRAAIERLGPERVEDPDCFDGDPSCDAGLRAIRFRLQSDLAELELALRHSREVEAIAVRGATVYLTGGMSWGDPPTEVIEIVDRLRAVRGVLSAVGFEGEATP